MSLIGEIKQRQVKTAQRALPAMMIRPTVEDRISKLVAEMVEKKQIAPEEAEEVSKALMTRSEPEVKKQESLAFKQEAGGMAQAPSTFAGATSTAGLMTAFPWLFSRIPRAGRAMGFEKPMTLGKSFRYGFLPNFLPVSALFETVGHAAAPFSDPQHIRGERGYLQSMGESFRGAQEGMAERGAEARERYGAFGIPLQMFHGVMNPLASMSYLGRQVGETFTKPNIREWAQEAARRRQETLQP